MALQISLKLAARVSPEEAYAAEVHDQHACVDLRREIQRTLGLSQPLIVLPRIFRRGLKQVRRRLLHTGGQRTKIVRGTDLDNALFHRAEDAGHQGNSNPMTQLRMRK